VGTRLVELKHSGFGEGEAWERARAEARKGWEMGLENLQSIFRSGEDLRITRRPMMGINLGDFNEKIAGEIGVPVTEGVRIDQPLEGMGAQKAGLRSGDVIVEMDGKPIRAFGDLGPVLQARRAGDVIPVTFYRGPEKHSVQMTLSGRPLASFSLEPASIAGQVRSLHQEIFEEVRAVFDGVTEAEAGFVAAPQEWSAKEALCHLIEAEVGAAQSIADMIFDAEREFAEEGGNVRERLQAMLAVTPNLPELLARYQAAQREVAETLKRAEKLKRRKGALWRVGQNFLQFPGSHERSHIVQMKAAIEAARARG
jgi:hypothetical protein